MKRGSERSNPRHISLTDADCYSDPFELAVFGGPQAVNEVATPVTHIPKMSHPLGPHLLTPQRFIFSIPVDQ